MKLVDTHAHLDYFIRQNSLEDIVVDAKQAGVLQIVVASASPENWNEYENIAKKYSDFISWQIGIHPSDIDENSNLAIDALATYFTSSVVPVGIGEIGLDFHFLPKDVSKATDVVKLQKEIFKRQLLIAKDLDTNVCIHARDAVDESIEVMREVDFNFSKAVFHCFAGNIKQLKYLNSLGARASFTGIITYPSADEMRECMLVQGLDKLMFETDCPYLAPVPMRKNTNQPAYVKYTVEAAAKLFSIDANELAEITTSNALSFFR